jgi:hypothetical protein
MDHSASPGTAITCRFPGARGSTSREPARYRPPAVGQAASLPRIPETRKPLALLLAASGGGVVDEGRFRGVGGARITATILASRAVITMFVSAVSPASAFSIVLWQLGGGKRSP